MYNACGRGVYMKRIGIVAAMQEEFEEIETKMRDVEIKLVIISVFWFNVA